LARLAGDAAASAGAPSPGLALRGGAALSGFSWRKAHFEAVLANTGLSCSRAPLRRAR
jgi:hypothetical protein